MTIRGYFGHYGAPMVRAWLGWGDGREPIEVHFLLDTGAYRSLLSLQEIHRLGVSIHELRRSVGTAVVFGGRAQFYSLSDVTITFETDQGPRSEHLAQVFTAISPATGEHRKRPRVISLLGRDLLDRFAIVIDKRAGVVLLTDEQVVRVERRREGEAEAGVGRPTPLPATMERGGEEATEREGMAQSPEPRTQSHDRREP